MRAPVLALLVGMLIGPLSSDATDPAIPVVPGTSLGIVPQGGAGGGDALYLNGGDIIGPRNLQGGGPGGRPFDIGAGSTEDPSNLAFNWDVGAKSLFYSGAGRKDDLKLSVAPDGTRMWFKGTLLAWFGPRGIQFYVKPRFVRAWQPR